MQGDGGEGLRSRRVIGTTPADVQFDAARPERPPEEPRPRRNSPHCARPFLASERRTSSIPSAIERGNLVVAEIEAREIGQLDLGEALELTAVVALRDRERGRRYAARWLQRWLDEGERSLDETGIVIAALQGLGGPVHATAVAALKSL